MVLLLLVMEIPPLWTEKLPLRVEPLLRLRKSSGWSRKRPLRLGPPSHGQADHDLKERRCQNGRNHAGCWSFAFSLTHGPGFMLTDASRLTDYEFWTISSFFRLTPSDGQAH